MKMVGHYGEFVDENIWKTLRYFHPDRLHHPTGLIRLHRPVGDIAEQILPSLHTNGYEIVSGGGVIVMAQPDRSAVVNIGVI
jgi:hypothetical protein